jgi:hypothetical protein
VAIIGYYFTSFCASSLLFNYLFLFLPGLLYSGCSAPVSQQISNCYTLFLTSNYKKQLDPGYPTPRQRVEFRGLNAPDNSTFKYTWKYFLGSSVGTTQDFFHLMQVFSTGDDGPIVTLDAVNGKAQIKDYYRPCGSTSCPSIPLAGFAGQVTYHTMTLTCGPAGMLNYVIKDGGGNTLISYASSGTMGFNGT